MRQKIINEKGYILVTTLIVLIILSIFGLALINISSTESLQSKQYEKSLQAKYLAKSGADIMAEYIINNIDDFEEKYENKTNNFPFKKDLNGGSISVDVEKTIDGLDIISEGTFDKNTKKMKLSLKKTIINSDALFTKALEKVDKLTNIKYKKDLPAPIISNPISNGNLYKKHKDIKIDLRSDKRYGDVEVDNGYTLEIETGGEDHILIVDNFIIDGHIKLSDDGGRVFLFVKELVSFKNSYKDAKNQLIIFAMDGSTIEMSPSSDKTSYLYIYAPFASIKLSGSAEISGAIIASSNNHHKIEEEKVYYRPLEKPINIDGYTLFDTKYIYIKDRYDNVSK